MVSGNVTFVRNLQSHKVDHFCRDPLTGQESLFDFNICLFHRCLECYPEDIIHFHFGQTLKQRHALTMQRKTDLIAMGYKYVDVWEHLFHNVVGANPAMK